MELSQAETFLGMWAIVATVVAIWFKSKNEKSSIKMRMNAVLLAKLATGEIKAKTDRDGFTVVEDDNMKIKFKRQDTEEEI